MAIDVLQIRSHFPALSATSDRGSIIHLDNPAGTQVPRRVVERMTAALTEFNANLGGSFQSSREATDTVQAAHAALADLLNAASSREIIIGANMTTLAFALSRSLGLLFEPGDEIIVTRMEHDANVTPWKIMAEERGLLVRTLEFDPETYRFDLRRLDELLSKRTRFAAISYASNLIGTVNDVRTFCAKAHAAGALSFVDAVHYAPHGPIDVRSLGCDFLACSVYKFFGPHLGVLWAREAMLERLKPYKLRASSNELPSRFETGTPSVEGLAGILGAIEYLEWVGRTMGPEYLGRFSGMSERGRALHAAMTAITDYERYLSARLIARLKDHGDITIHGITANEDLNERVPTVSISKANADPAELEKALADWGICVWSGHSYALDVIGGLGITHPNGVLRLGAVHYNTVEEIDRAVRALAVL